MIRYLRHDEIDKQRWDAFINKALNGNVYAYSWYLDIVQPNWGALVDTSCVMPLTQKKKYGIHYLCQPFFAQQLGVFSTEPLEESVKRFVDAIPAKYRLVEIRLNEKNILRADDHVRFHRNHLLDLNRPYQTIQEHYHTNTKRNLSKALRSDLTIDTSASIDAIINLFRANRGATVQHWGDAEYQRLSQLSDCAVAKGKALVYGVRCPQSQEIIAGALFMISHQRITFLFSGCGQEGKEHQAMTFLIDNVIQQFADKPYTFDFEGSDDDNLARFYQGFGSRQVHYPELSYRLWPLNFFK